MIRLNIEINLISGKHIFIILHQIFSLYNDKIENEMNDNYDLSYDQSAHYFGEEAEPFLIDNWKFLDRAYPILDKGSGQ